MSEECLHVAPALNIELLIRAPLRGRSFSLFAGHLLAERTLELDGVAVFRVGELGGVRGPLVAEHWIMICVVGYESKAVAVFTSANAGERTVLAKRKNQVTRTKGCRSVNWTVAIGLMVFD